MRLISDVKSIEVNKRKENQFVIKYSDGLSYTYETKQAETTRMSCLLLLMSNLMLLSFSGEIVQKVTTCMMLHNERLST